MTEPSSADPWLSMSQAGDLLGLSASTMRRRMSDPAARERWGLHEGVDWRLKPLTDPATFQLRRSAVDRLITGGTGE